MVKTRKPNRGKRKARGRNRREGRQFAQPAGHRPGVKDAATALVEEASGAWLHDDGEAARAYATALAQLPDDLVSLSITQALRRAVAAAWGMGWMPADLVRFVRRELTRRHAGLVIDAIADEMRAYSVATVDDRWRDQLDALEAKVWWSDTSAYLRIWGDRESLDPFDALVCALEALSRIGMLPALEQICPPPGKGRSNARRAKRQHVDERTLNRVRRLLAKAEATDYPAEAETFTSAAQSLMAKHSIDAAMLAAATGAKDGPEALRVGVDSPYEAPKAVLLAVVAEANRCRSVWSKRLGFATLLGFREDMEAVELLFTSLLVQATAAMTHEGAKRDAFGRSRTRSFRQSFLNSFAIRIGERLREAAEGIVKKAAEEDGSTNLLPVLAARDEAVKEAMDALFPKRGTFSGGSITDREGWVAGHAAADLATLHGRSEVTGG